LKTQQRDIVLVPFPFSDTQTTKVRPALVISNNDYNQAHLDVVVLAVTSNIQAAIYKVEVSQSKLESGKLPAESAVRVDKPYSVLRSKIIKVQAQLSEAAFQDVLKALNDLFIMSTSSKNTSESKT
jgi:mRNA interferase MazF